MILSIPIEKVIPVYITFLDAKNNIVIDGKFSKILYVDEKTIMNSLFIHYDATSMTLLYDIERHILESYMTFFHCNKKCIYMLKQNLSMTFRGSLERSVGEYQFAVAGEGKLKKTTSGNALTSSFSTPKTCIKISGVWENDYNIGITYKTISLMDTCIL